MSQLKHYEQLATMGTSDTANAAVAGGDEEKKEQPDSDDDEVDIETLRRQRAVVEHMRGEFAYQFF